MSCTDVNRVSRFGITEGEKMSAYAKEQGSQVISLLDSRDRAGGAIISGSPEENLSHQDLPLLPKIDHELSRYFSVSRRLETASNQLKVYLKKANEELREMRIRYSALKMEVEDKTQSLNKKEKSILSKAEDFKQSEKKLCQRIQDLSHQVEALRKEKALISAHFQSTAKREESLRAALVRAQCTEKTQTEQIASLTEKLNQINVSLQKFKFLTHQSEVEDKKSKALFESLDQEKKNLEQKKKESDLEIELLQSSLDLHKKNEKGLREALLAHQSKQKCHTEEIKKLHHRHSLIQQELKRYKASWQLVVTTDHRAKLVFKECEDLKAKLAEMRESTDQAFKAHFDEREVLKQKIIDLQSRGPVVDTELSRKNEKMTVESWELKQEIDDLKERLRTNKSLMTELEERVKKEARDKQIALNCLQSAEMKLEAVSSELETKTKREMPNYPKPRWDEFDQNSISLGV
jgi:chromosome segregation ATPase